MANGRLRVILNGGEITGSSDGKRIELYIPSGIEFRMEGDFSNRELTKKDVKNIVNKALDKVFAQSTPAPAPEAVATSAPAPTRMPSVDEVNKALEEAYNQGRVNYERALYDEIRAKVDSNNVAIQELTKTLSDLAKEIGMANRPKK